MVSDRDYMREPEYRDPLSTTAILAIALVVIFGLQTVLEAWRKGVWEYPLMLTGEGIRHGKIWQLLTFQFLHAGLLHLVFNGIGLWGFGRFVESLAGRGRFLLAYLGAGVAGGLLHVGLSFIMPQMFDAPVLGASAGVCGLLAIFATLQPESPLHLYGIIPIPARWILWGMIVVSVLMLFAPGVSQVAHAAHLGGILFGLMYVRLGWHDPHLPLPWERSREPSKKKRIGDLITDARWQVSADKTPTDDASITREIDPILEKIAQHGIHSLTDRERTILESARKKLSGK